VHHTTLINSVKQVRKLLPDAYDPEVIPQVAELDELQTYVKKTHKIWLWTAIDHFRSGILGWVSADHSSETFESLWDKVSAWKCYFYVRNRWSVYPMFIADGDEIISQTYMTLFRGENSRMRHSASKTTSPDSLLF
jgi:IS1 family transposase